MRAAVAVILFALAIPLAAQQHFQVVIINYNFGRVFLTTTVTQDSVVLMPGNYNSVQKREARKLTVAERKEFTVFLQAFPLSSLKDKYVNDHVEDGTQIGFDIKIDGTEKKIFIANVYQKNLGALTDEVVKLLPYDAIDYNKRTVPFEE